jgi:hypothetical protein
VGNGELNFSVVVENSGDLSTTVLALALQRAQNSGISLGNGGLDGLLFKKAMSKNVARLNHIHTEGKKKGKKKK